MRKINVVFAMLLAQTWLFAFACGKSDKNESADKHVARDHAGATNHALGRGAGRQPAGAVAGQGEVVDGTGPQVEVVSLGKSVQDKSYTLTLTGPGQVEKGKPAVFELTLVPKTPYHTNKLFPFKLSFDRVSENVKLDKSTYVKKDASLFSPEKAVFKIAVTPTGSLPATVSGIYQFSVCTPKFCETPKARVELTLGRAPASAGRPAAARQASAASGTKARGAAADGK